MNSVHPVPQDQKQLQILAGSFLSNVPKSGQKQQPKAKVDIEKSTTASTTMNENENSSFKTFLSFQFESTIIDGMKMTFFTNEGGYIQFTIVSLKFADQRSEVEYQIHKQESAWKYMPCLFLVIFYLILMIILYPKPYSIFPIFPLLCVITFLSSIFLSWWGSWYELKWWSFFIMVAINSSMHFGVISVCQISQMECDPFISMFKIWFGAIVVFLLNFSLFLTAFQILLFEMAYYLNLYYFDNSAISVSKKGMESVFYLVLISVITYSLDLAQRRLFYRTNKLLFTSHEKRAEENVGLINNNLGQTMENLTNARLARRKSAVKFGGNLVREIPWEDLEVNYKIAKGPVATIYSAKWQGTNFAVKKIEVTDIQVSFMERLITDLSKICALRHPNICLYVAASLSPPNIAIIMELMPKGSLTMVFQSKHDLSYNQRYRILQDAVYGLVYLHNTDPPTLHGNMKSSNILCGTHLEIKVADFGFTCFGSNISASSAVYVAPELFSQGSNVSEKSDVYAFAVIIWEVMTTKEPLYPGIPADIQSISEATFAGRRLEIPTHVIESMQHLLCSCWNADPNQRPTMSKVLECISQSKQIQGSTERGFLEKVTNILNPEEEIDGVKLIKQEDLEVGSFVGKGGSGEVYLASYKGTAVACKVIDLLVEGRKTKLKIVLNEVKMLQNLRHPNVIQYIGSSVSASHIIVVSSYMSSGDLWKLCLKSQPPWRLRLKLLMEVCLGISYLHTLNPVVIHRDIKAQNILVSKSWDAVVSDFGLSILKPPGALIEGFCGTRLFIPPEMLMNKAYDEMIDIYSFGILLSQVITCSQPYSHVNIKRVPLPVLNKQIIEGSRPLLDLLAQEEGGDDKESIAYKISEESFAKTPKYKGARRTSAASVEALRKGSLYNSSARSNKIELGGGSNMNSGGSVIKKTGKGEINSEAEGASEGIREEKKNLLSDDDNWIYKVLCNLAQRCWVLDSKDRPSAFCIARVLETTLHLSESTTLENGEAQQFSEDVEGYVGDILKKTTDGQLPQEISKGDKNNIVLQLVKCFSTVAHSLMAEFDVKQKLSLNKMYRRLLSISEICCWSPSTYIVASIYLSRCVTITKTKMSLEAIRDMYFGSLFLAQVAMDSRVVAKIVKSDLKIIFSKYLEAEEKKEGDVKKEIIKEETGGVEGKKTTFSLEQLLVIEEEQNNTNSRIIEIVLLILKRLDFNVKVGMPIFQQYYYEFSRIISNEEGEKHSSFLLPPFNLVATLEIERATKTLQDTTDSLKDLKDDSLKEEVHNFVIGGFFKVKEHKIGNRDSARFITTIFLYFIIFCVLNFFINI